MSKSVCEEVVFNQLYREYAPQLRNYLYYKCRNLPQAEDLVQESFLKLWKKCAEAIFETVVGYLYTISNRLLIDQVRSQNVTLKFEKQHLESTKVDDPYFILRTAEFKDKIENVISNLPDGQREAFLLNRIDKLTFKEIALRLEISENAVEKRMTKALLHLKEKIVELKNYKI